MVTYYTINNGGRCFRVVINRTSNRVRVYQSKEAFLDEQVISRKSNCDKQINTVLLDVHPRKIFIGCSEKDEMTLFSLGFGKEFDGNSILLHMNKHKYIWIGDSIQTFRSQHEIIAFSSPVGNSGVPYPYAIDSKQLIYLLIENVILLNYTSSIKRNPYTQYYSTYTITQFEQIDGFYIGGKKTAMTFEPSPELIFDRISEDHRPHKIYVVVRRKKHELSKDEYTGIVKRFGSERGFVKLDMTQLNPTPSAQLHKIIPQKQVTGKITGSKLHSVNSRIKNASFKKDAASKTNFNNAPTMQKINIKTVDANHSIFVKKTVRVNGRTRQYTANTTLQASGEWLVKDVTCVTTTATKNHPGNIPWTMTWADAIDALCAGYLGPFLDECTCVSPHAPSLFWETPAFSRSTLSRQFEFITLPAPHLARERPNVSAFAAHVNAPKWSNTATFTNLNGDATLVIPCPPPGLSKLPKYGHLGDFVRFAPTVQRNSFWRAVGVAAREAAKSDEPTWLSTAGSGVPWLHIRLDSRPKYYRHIDYK